MAAGNVSVSVSPNDIPPEAQLDEIRVVLVGKTGAGKSATGNTIVGEKVFPVNATGLSSVIATGLSTESQCQHKKFVRFERKVLLIDTPGVFDTDRSPEVIKKEIHQFLIVSAPGPHAIIFVTSAAWRFTPEEVECIKRLHDMFGRGLSQHLFVVITRTEDWEEDGVTAKSFLSSLPEEAKAVLRDALDADRILPFQNTLRGEDGEAQVRQLLDMIARHIEAKGGACYTNEQWQEAEREMQEKIRALQEKQEKAEKEKLDEMRRREEAKLKEEQRKKIDELENQHRQEMAECERQIKEAEAEKEKKREKTLRDEEEKLKEEALAAAPSQKPLPAPEGNPLDTQVDSQALGVAGTSGSHAAPEGPSRGSQARPQQHSRSKAQGHPAGKPCVDSMDVETTARGGKHRVASPNPQGGGRQTDRNDRPSGGTSKPSGNQSQLPGRQTTAEGRTPLEKPSLAAPADTEHRQMGSEVDRQQQVNAIRQESNTVEMLLGYMKEKDEEHRREMAEMHQRLDQERIALRKRVDFYENEILRDLARKQAKCIVM